MRRRDNTGTIIICLVLCSLGIAAAVVGAMFYMQENPQANPLRQLMTHEQKKAKYKKEFDKELRAAGEAMAEAWHGPPAEQLEMWQKLLRETTVHRSTALESGNEELMKDADEVIAKAKTRIEELQKMIKR